MRWFPRICFVAMMVLSPSVSRAQSVGRVDCRAGGFVYLYSSMTSLEIRETLQCGEEVAVTGRYDKYFGVRTTKGEIGYLPVNNLVLYRDGDKKSPTAAPGSPVRERVPYDAPAAQPTAAPAPPAASEFVLRNGVQIRLRLAKTITSSTAKVGDHVDFEVAEDVVIDGLCVVAKGAAAAGTVSEAEGKKRLGHGGTLGITLNSVQMVNNEKTAVRGYQEARGSSSAAPMISGKDVAFIQGTEFTALVDGDVHLKRESFAAKSVTAAPSAQATSQPRN